ncbi:dicarboxylate/amino acid:cation symporter [Gudongella sp. DL1XJH-153]|uniref:dicarboxylate/amino acid:cation symporter n=1 Tax=Gudongella sp. DL1XJH-153 TaxID=3409804 RepID=UPI003BB7FC20
MKKGKYGLTTKVLMALVIGIITGILVYNMPSGTLKDTVLVDGLFLFLGQVFLRAIMMLVVPLVFISLVNGAANMGDVTKLGRVGSKTVLFYLTTTAIAIVIALTLGVLLKPGIGLDMGAVEAVEVTMRDKVPLVQTFYEMIPNNIVGAMASGSMLQIIVFALLTGVSLSLLGEKGAYLANLFERLNDLIMKLVEIVMIFAPIGVFGLIARTFSTVGYSAMIPLMKYIGTVYIGLLIHATVVYGSMFKIFSGLSLRTFYKKFLPAMSVAFSTASSGATIPVTLEITERDLGVSKEISSFTVPLGATINMDGTAIMQGVASLFVAQVYGIEMTLAMMLTIVLTATLASIGTAGVPGAGAIMLTMVLQSVGLPLEGIGLIMGIDRLVDMARTAINVTGDAVCTTIIAKSEGGLNEDVFNS